MKEIVEKGIEVQEQWSDARNKNVSNGCKWTHLSLLNRKSTMNLHGKFIKQNFCRGRAGNTISNSFMSACWNQSASRNRYETATNFENKH